MQNFRITVIAVLLVFCSAAGAQENDWSPRRMWVVGGDDRGWVVAADRPVDDSQPEIRMWFIAPDSKNKEIRSKLLPPAFGDLVHVGADAARLRVLFSKSAMWSFLRDGTDSAGALWKEYAVEPPLAWGGDATEPILFALVRTESLVARQQPTTTAPASAETELDRGPAIEASGHQEGWTLFERRGGFWRPRPVLDDANEGQAFWLTGRGGTVYLFWRTPANRYFFSTCVENNWSASQAVPVAGDVVRAWAAAAPDGPLFITAVAVSPETARLDLHLLEEGGWSRLGTVREGTDYLRIRPEETGVGIVAGRLGVARIGDGHAVEFGSAEIAPSPLIHLAPLPTTPEAKQPVETWQDAVMTGVALGILTLALYTRREQITRPAVVPKGFEIAPVWKRALATAIDFCPAAIVTMPWFIYLRNEIPLSDDMNVLVEQFQDPEIVARFVPLNLAILLGYGLWCYVWETASGTTPGKRIFNCRVLDADGIIPAGRKIVIRNLCRVVMIGLGPSGILVTLMLMMMFTRNRQRLGDLLAHTIVVQGGEGAAPLSTDAKDDEDSSET